MRHCRVVVNRVSLKARFHDILWIECTVSASSKHVLPGTVWSGPLRRISFSNLLALRHCVVDLRMLRLDCHEIRTGRAHAQMCVLGLTLLILRCRLTDLVRLMSRVLVLVAHWTTDSVALLVGELILVRWRL